MSEFIMGGPEAVEGAAASPFLISGSTATLQLKETDQGVNGKLWDINVNAGILALRTRTDANGAGTTAFAITRSGTSITDFTITPALNITGLLTANAGINTGTSQAINSTTSRFEQIGGSTLGTWNSAGLGIGMVPLNTLDITGTVGLLGKMSIGATYSVLVAPTSGMIVEGLTGIGTASPACKLNVTGVSAAPANTGTATNANFRVRGAGNGCQDMGNISGGNSYIQITDATNLALFYNLLLQPNGGNVGIGMTPTRALDITGTLGATGAVTFGSTTQTTTIYATTDGGGVASTTGLTGTTNTTTTNAYTVKGGQGATTANTGWIKIYIGTSAAWVPYWLNATP